MINHIGGGSEYLAVSGGSSSGPYVSMNNPSAGMVRFNGNNFEVYDGGSWLAMYGAHAMIDVSNKTREILQWAESKMHMEREIMKLVETNATVADAWNTYLDAGKKLEVIMALVKENE